MAAIQLTPAQRKEHRAAAHHLDPVVMIGSEGLTPAVLKETDAALKAHGLIKVRVFSDDRGAREGLLVQLAHELGAAPIQHIGKLLVLWRPLPEKERTEERSAPGQGSEERRVGQQCRSRWAPHRSQNKKVTILGNQRLTTGGLVKRAKNRPTSTKKRQQD